MNNAVFVKTMENVRKNRDTNRTRNYSELEPSYHTIKFFTEHLLAIDMKRNQRYL